jgi:hypothetical protein
MTIRASLVLSGGLLLLPVPAFAQLPQLSVSTTVVNSGASVTVTLTGTPGRHFVIAGSSTNAGLTHAGVPVNLGLDVALFALGVLDNFGSSRR